MSVKSLYLDQTHREEDKDRETESVYEMRFKAKLSKDSVLFLHSLCVSCEKLGHTGAFHFTEEEVHISVIVDSPDAPKCYSELTAKHLFDIEYRIESQSDNMILFEAPLSLLSWALSSGKTSDICQLKLVKRQQKPFLSFEARSSTSVNGLVDIVHDIPVKIMRARSVYIYLCLSFYVCVYVYLSYSIYIYYANLYLYLYL